MQTEDSSQLALATFQLILPVCNKLDRSSSSRKFLNPRGPSGRAAVTGFAPFPPPGWCLVVIVAHFGFSIPVFHTCRCSSNFANLRSRIFALSITSGIKDPFRGSNLRRRPQKFRDYVHTKTSTRCILLKRDRLGSSMRDACIRSGIHSSLRCFRSASSELTVWW